MRRPGQKVSLQVRTFDDWCFCDENLKIDVFFFFSFCVAVVEVPEGSGALAYMMAKAGIKSEQFPEVS